MPARICPVVTAASETLFGYTALSIWCDTMVLPQIVEQTNNNSVGRAV
jgi:hypothetical protein